MGQIEDALVIGVRVDGGHISLEDLEIVMQNLGQRRHAVGSAGSVGNDVVLLRIIIAVIDSQNNGNVGIGGRS